MQSIEKAVEVDPNSLFSKLNQISDVLATCERFLLDIESKLTGPYPKPDSVQAVSSNIMELVDRINDQTQRITNTVCDLNKRLG